MGRNTSKRVRQEINDEHLNASKSAVGLTKIVSDIKGRIWGLLS